MPLEDPPRMILAEIARRLNASEIAILLSRFAVPARGRDIDTARAKATKLTIGLPQGKHRLWRTAAFAKPLSPRTFPGFIRTIPFNKYKEIRSEESALG